MNSGELSRLENCFYMSCAEFDWSACFVGSGRVEIDDKGFFDEINLVLN